MAFKTLLMNLTWELATTYSVLIPAVTGWVRFKRIHPTFYPLLFVIWLGLLNELISSVLIFGLRSSNAVNSNFYVLAEALLLLWQFERWGTFSNKKQFYQITFAAILCAWMIDNFLISGITHFCSYFMIFYSTLICLLSIDHINFIVIRERKNILRNAGFLICATFVVYHSYKAMVEAFWLYGKGSPAFKDNVYKIHGAINFLSNCIFALAILWAPQKQKFSLPSS